MTKLKRLYARGYLLLIAVVSLAGMSLFLANQKTPVPPSWGVPGGMRDSLVEFAANFSLNVILSLTSGGFGVLILRRDVENKIGRWLCIMGSLAPLQNLLNEFAVYGYFTVASPRWFHTWAAWFANWLWLPLFGSMVWTLAIFPDGTALTNRWRRFIQLSLALFIGPLFFALISDRTLTSAFTIPNPLPIPALFPFSNFLFVLGVAFMLVTILVVFAAVFTRFTGQGGLARQQMKWLLSGVGLMAAMVMLGFGLRFGLDLALGGLLVNTSFIGPVVGVGVAILRYRLYDIDLIIRRTLQYSLLTGLLTGIFFGGVALLQAAVTALGGQSSPVIIVLTTLAIAALFNPLRRRIQDFIDRRFYRQKYDAEQALAVFAEAARSETDLAQLSGRLTATVQDTLQPAFTALWLAKFKNRKA